MTVSFYDMNSYYYRLQPQFYKSGFKVAFMLPNVGHREIAGSSPALGVAAFSPSLMNHHWLLIKKWIISFSPWGQTKLNKTLLGLEYVQNKFMNIFDVMSNCTTLLCSNGKTKNIAV